MQTALGKQNNIVCSWAKGQSLGNGCHFDMPVKNYGNAEIGSLFWEAAKHPRDKWPALLPQHEVQRSSENKWGIDRPKAGGTHQGEMGGERLSSCYSIHAAGCKGKGPWDTAAAITSKCGHT